MVPISKLKKPFSGKKINRLVINPSGMLRYIPFAALYDGERYMIEKYQLLPTGGTDFHGTNRPGIEIGTGVEGNMRVPYSFLENIQRALEK